MNRVTLLLAAALAMFVAEPAWANGFNPMMLAGMVGPMMHVMQPHPYGYEPHPHGWGPGHGHYRPPPPPFQRSPIFIEHRRPPFMYERPPEVIEGGGYGPGYDGNIGGYGGGYAGGGEHFRSFHFHTEHVHIEHFHEHVEHVQVHREMHIPRPIVHHYYHRRVYVHRTHGCCNCGCNTVIVRYIPAPTADPPGDSPADLPAVDRGLTQSDIELLQSVYK